MLGNFEEVERLFKEFVHHYPNHGWGWINWSDQYDPFAKDKKCRDDKKAMPILEKGLNVTGQEDKGDVLYRLADLYAEYNMEEADIRH